MNRQDLQLRLETCPVLTEVPDSKAQEELETLLASDAFLTLYGLLLGTRQTHFAALAGHPLGNMEQVSRAAVLQGKIKGLEFLYSTAIEILPDAETPGAEEQR